MWFIYLWGILGLFILLWILALKPAKIREEKNNLFGNKYYAHRGLHDEYAGIPENSLPAFKRAVQQQIGIELDVHLSKDGIPVVFHDENLKRVCGVEADISELNAVELQKQHLRNTEYTIPLLKEVLQLIAGKVPIIIELKFERNYRLLCEKVNILLQHYQGNFCIESFDPRCVWWFRKNQKDIIRGQLAESFRHHGMKINIFLDFLLKNLLMNFLARPDFVAYNFEDVHRARSFWLCSCIYQVQKVLWVIRSPEQFVIAKKQNAILIFEGLDLRKLESEFQKINDKKTE